ncbi:hypothetical protein BDQ12DRAFT_688252 [Crucibulum laeve]|uniref:GDP-fucose protein O-fucosyltransferase-domain-containing protein n=1 Tax=Crucibulum laeve TaxID=68775 RepID=A0A5C3LSD5_9AGAR|nr:hypothetical protein BDQ12DRAFT_688252 [Crucibulum laeve]
MGSIRVKWTLIIATFCFITGLLKIFNSGSALLQDDRIAFGKFEHGSAARMLDSASDTICPPAKPPTYPTTHSWDTFQAVVGPPTLRYRDNLRHDRSYITSWANAGFTNQFMSYVNMIYLGTISDRIPIIPPFAPDHHIPRSAGVIPFGSLFNLTHLRTTLRLPLIEWRDLKTLPHPTLDPYSTSSIEHLGCWSASPYDKTEPTLAVNLVAHLGVDASYTRLPIHTHKQEDQNEAHVVLPSIAALVFPGEPSHPVDWYPFMRESNMGSKLSPEEHLACIDQLYFSTSGRESFEWEHAWSPAWRTVGKHLRFTSEMEELARGYLRRAFGVAGDVPPFIAIHVRRGDFALQCAGAPGSCLPQFKNYTDKVLEIQHELCEKQNIDVSHVLVTSDEQDPAFWADIRGHQSWAYINHTVENTLEKLGEWYLPFVEIVAQSMAKGFVGTGDSTFSLVSKRRVEDWNHGVTRWVQRGQTH